MFFLLLKKQGTSLSKSLLKYSEWDLNPHSRNGQGILSPSCLPIPPSEQLALVDCDCASQKCGAKIIAFFHFTKKNTKYCNFPPLFKKIIATCHMFFY